MDGKKSERLGGRISEAFDVKFRLGSPSTLDAFSISRMRRNVKENRCRQGGELDMTETLIIIAVTAASVWIMRIIDGLDTPKTNDRRKRA